MLNFKNISMENQIEKYPVTGSFYRHYKGGLYKVLSMAEHAETGEKMVIYRSIMFGTIFVRPLTEWNRPAFISSNNNTDNQVPRFRLSASSNEHQHIDDAFYKNKL